MMELKGSVTLVSRIVKLTYHSQCRKRQSGSDGEVSGCLLKAKPNSLSAEAALSQGMLAGLVFREERTLNIQPVGSVCQVGVCNNPDTAANMHRQVDSRSYKGLLERKGRSGLFPGSTCEHCLANLGMLRAILTLLTSRPVVCLAKHDGKTPTMFVRAGRQNLLTNVT